MPEHPEDLASYKSGLDVIAHTYIARAREHKAYIHECRQDFISDEEQVNEDRSQVCVIS